MERKQAARPSFFGQFRRGRRRGLALFDVILALGIIGLLIGGGVLLLQQGTGRQQTNETLSLINQIRAGVQGAYAGQGNYTGLSAMSLHLQGKMPVAALTNDTDNDNGQDDADWQHPFGGTIRVEGFGGRRFAVELYDLDNEPCQDIIRPYVDKRRAATGLVSIAVGSGDHPGGGGNPATGFVAAPTGGAVGGRGPGVTGAAMPIVTADLANWCTHGDNTNHVQFWFTG